MLIHTGRALFLVGLLAGTFLAAKSPSFEAAREAAAKLAPSLQGGTVRVRVQPSDDLPARKAEALERDLSQALLLEGIARSPEAATSPVADAPLAAFTVSARRNDDAVALSVTRPGAAAPIATGVVEAERTWPNTTPAWALCAGLAGLGVALWRIGAKARAKAAAVDEGDATDNPFALLAGLLETSRALAGALSSLSAEALLARVDALHEGYVLPFTLVRQRVIDRLGMREGSEILVTLAYGERMLNRTWSAAADGHLPEARACFPEALAAFEEADRLAKRALGAGAGGPSGAPVAVGEKPTRLA